MRLRSSHFVFGLLLLCSVQFQQECTLHLLAGTISHWTTATRQHPVVSRASAKNPIRRESSHGIVLEAMCLDSASAAAHRAPWPMARPALSATMVGVHTGLLRA